MRKLLAVMMVVAMVSAANAATVYVWSECYGDGTFDVIASVSPADNGGLAISNVPLVCPDTGELCDLSNEYPAAGSIKNVAPQTRFLMGTMNFPVNGFVLFRSGTGTLPDNPVGAAQDTIASAGAAMVYGIGQGIVDIDPGSVSGNFHEGHPLVPPNNVGIPLDGTTADGLGVVHLRPADLPAGHQYGIVMGQGVAPGDCASGCCCPDFEEGGSMVVFDDDSGTEVVEADIVNLGCIPEPATLALLALGGLALLRRR